MTRILCVEDNDDNMFVLHRRLTRAGYEVKVAMNGKVGVEWATTLLPDLILMLDHNTDNAWLDVGELALSEGGGYPQWHSADIAWLAEEWRRAEPILERIQRLLDWQNQTPEEISFKLTAVRSVLLDAYHRAQQAEEATSEALV